MVLRAPGYWQSRRGIALLLYPFSLLFRWLVWLRRLGFRYGLLQSTNATVPVVVVGNLTVDGAGKTPLVISLVEQLQQRGWQPGVVSRGYGGSEVAPTLVTSAADHFEVGDEALMLSRRTGVPVAVSNKRVAAVELLTTGQNCNVIVSDDGLQHYALGRQLEICVIDIDTGLGNGWCLPAGPLREPPSRLHEVDLIVYSGTTHNVNVSQSVRKTIANVLGQSANGYCVPVSDSTLVSTSDSSVDSQSARSHAAPIQAAYTLRVECVINLQAPSLRKSLADFSEVQVHAVAAIGRPNKFFRQLRAAGLDIIEHAFPDHHAFHESDLVFNDGLDVLMTEKDSVKCEAWAHHNFWTVNVAAELDSGIVDAVLDRLTGPAQYSPVQQSQKKQTPEKQSKAEQTGL